MMTWTRDSDCTKIVAVGRSLPLGIGCGQPQARGYRGPSRLATCYADGKDLRLTAGKTSMPDGAAGPGMT